MDAENSAASAACKSTATATDAASDEACNKCCRAQHTSRGTVYGSGRCECYDGHSAVAAPAIAAHLGIEIADAKAPPSFKFSGDCDSMGLAVMGPFADIDALRDYNKRPTSLYSTPEKVLWSLAALNPVAMGGALPTVRYGVMPKEFKERLGPAPALVAGQLYLARVSGTAHLIDGSMPNTLRHVCFQAQVPKVVELPCGFK